MVSVDETTDVKGRYTVNIIISTLNAEYLGKIFLFHSNFIEKTNHSTNEKVFNKAMFILWSEGVKYNNVFLFVSDMLFYTW